MRTTTSRSIRIFTNSLLANLTRPKSSTYHHQPFFALPTTTRLLLHSQIRKMASSTTHPILLKKPVKLACIQLASGADKSANLSHAADKVREAASGGANIVVLPECFNSPYGCDFFPSYAEQLLPSPPTAEQSPSFHALSAMARDNGIYLVGGSIPELAIEEGTEDKKTYYNTSLVFGPDGKLLASHRKVHLFDIDIPGKIKFKESDVLSPGNSVTLVDLPDYGRIAVAICYDIRFPELAMIAARKGCFALVYPGAFNTTTGPLHWRLQGQARAMDNQIYVALCSPARDMSASYHAYGHSLIVDPMARVLVEAEESETIVSAELDGTKIEEARSGIPLRDQRRFDIYPDVSQAKVSS
ncbi:nitrilase [Neurospora intermedia]|uniref:Nitrilase n=1 Tax=Neurospora intermedia TaxID=5142 RepID=A0ABR3D3K0_NEUIN